MLWTADNPGKYAGQVVGDGHCVAFVRTASGVPHTSNWQRGAQLREEWPVGLVIATFDANGKYGNHTDGTSHTAILVKILFDGLRVWDQWVDHPVAQRTIRFKAGVGLPCDDGDSYHPVETADAPATA